MLAHKIKDILTIVPEAMDMVKQASLEQDYPTDSRDSTIASYLAMHYMMKVAHKPVDYDAIFKVEKAASLYNIEKEVKPLLEKMDNHVVLEKSASTVDLGALQARFEGDLTGFSDLEKCASEAQEMYATYGEDLTSDIIKTFAGKDILNKEAALGALVARYEISKDAKFIKLASILRNVDELNLTDGEKVKLGNTVTALDKQANLQVKGFNFWKEAFVKEAAFNTICEVRLSNIPYPYEKIQKLGKARISQAIGQDVANELTGNAAHDKQVLETLPLDLQEILSRMLKAI